MNHQPVAVALVHHPVIDRRGDRVTTAVTNLDLHDIARVARTYGVGRFYVVTPVVDQAQLVERILGHWQEGFGASYKPHRGEALSLVRVTGTLQEAMADWEEATGVAARPVLTGANREDGVGFDACREARNRQPLFLVFGTGWGLAPEIFEQGWTVLEPIRGGSDYNHLPVRAAVAIILDRLLGERQ